VTSWFPIFALLNQYTQALGMFVHRCCCISSVGFSLFCYSDFILDVSIRCTRYSGDDDGDSEQGEDAVRSTNALSLAIFLRIGLQISRSRDGSNYWFQMLELIPFAWCARHVKARSGNMAKQKRSIGRHKSIRGSGNSFSFQNCLTIIPR
jgi:hypothetical protein